MGKARLFSQLIAGNGTIKAAKLGEDVPITEQVATASALPSSASIGEQAFVQDTNRLYIWNGTGWYNIALINTSPTWDSSGQPASSYGLDADSPQDATVITLAASDPEGIPISYSHVTGGSMDSIATISQDSSVFTITPKTEAQAPDGGTGTITFRASDGVNIIPYVSSFTLTFASWDNATQQQKIQSSDIQAYDQFGKGVSISSDGNTAIVGANGENSSAGAAYVFTRSGTTWTQQQKIQSNDIQQADNFGTSVSISSDGNTAVVGAPGEDTGGNAFGAAYIFTRSGSTWSQQQKIQAAVGGTGDDFGDFVSISGDGDTVIIGAWGEDDGGSNAGAAYIFTRSGSTWSQQQKLIASNAGASDYFGKSVSISNDGNTAIVGAYGEDTGGNGRGSAYIFTRSGSSWSQQQKIQASDAENSDEFGKTVAISGDGDTVIVNAQDEDTGGASAGAAYIFTRSGSSWSQQAKIQASDKAAGDEFGSGVSISSDGNAVVVGAWKDDDTAADAGSAYIFTRSGTTWTQQDKVQASDAEAGSRFGFKAVAISGDGKTAIIGAGRLSGPGSNAGAAYIFVQG